MVMQNQNYKKKNIEKKIFKQYTKEPIFKGTE